MFEFEVVLMEKRYGRVIVRADGLEQAKEVALQRADVEWEDATETEPIFAIRVD